MTGGSSLPIIDHPARAREFNRDVARTEWHDKALWFVRQKRDGVTHAVPEWEELRNAASAIKSHTLSRLDEYLEEFESHALANGIRVHWAPDAAAHNAVVLGILRERGAKKLVKSKSMLTEECHLNEVLEESGIDVVDTDLGERIVQLAGEPPSHIVMPAIHVKKEEIGDLFHRTLGTEAGVSDPQYLAGVARKHLREEFLGADAALTGVNFGLADTGGFVVCTNEGNADLGAHLAPVHIASMGIEKLIPREADLGVFLRLLARSATGQPSTVYASHFHAPRPGTEIHLVIVDNGRSVQLGREHFRGSLKCIRCGACMNTCPIYRRSGGHSYGNAVPGPIGSILAPGQDLRKYSTLPFASTLCGSCSDVCPVKIDIHGQLYRWRQIITEEVRMPRKKAWSDAVASRILEAPRIFRAAGAVARRALRLLPRAIVYARPNAWGRARELPPPPPRSFRDWYVRNRSDG